MSLLRAIQDKHTLLSDGTTIPSATLRRRTVTFDLSGADCICESHYLADPADPGEFLDVRIQLSALTPKEEIDALRSAEAGHQIEAGINLTKAAWRSVALVRPAREGREESVLDTLKIDAENIDFWWQLIGTTGRTLTLNANQIVNSGSQASLGKFQASLKEALL